MKKKIVPVLIAVVLIILTVGIGLGTGIMEKYSYSNERVDIKEYLGISGEEETAIILNNELIEANALFREGQYYLPFSFIYENINERFYYDKNENLLIYTMPTYSVTAVSADAGYTEQGSRVDTGWVVTFAEGEEIYVAADYVKKFVNFSYVAKTQPNCIQIATKWEEKTVASIKKNTKLREKGGIKSAIVTDAFKGEKVTILETMETWSKVINESGIIGYVENKRLNESEKVAQTPVTEVTEPVFTSLTADYKINLVWHLVTNKEANQKGAEYIDRTKNVNTIVPTWFALSDNEGNISSLADSEYVTQMHNRGLKVWAMFDNFTNKEVSTKEVLSYTSKRTRLIDKLINEMKTYGLDGINLDFEQIDEEYSKDYIQFIRELSVACRNNGFVFSVDNYVPMEHTAHYNRTEQGIFADYVVIMGYDEHWLGSKEAGSVASIDFVDNGIANTLLEVPKEKVINALPFYTILWGHGEEVSSKAYGMDAAAELLTSKGVTTVWDEITCQNYASYTEDGVNYEIWLEDAASIETKINIMKKHDIAGVAGWRLGLESAATWDKIAMFLQE